MRELVITRHNHLIDPSLHIWGWEVAVYLFLGGLVAGMMIILGYLLLHKRYTDDECIYSTLPLLGIVLLSIGMFALFLDLEHKLYVWRMYVVFEISSPMSWGAWILLLVYPALIAAAFVKLPVFSGRWTWLMKRSEILADQPAWIKRIGVINICVGILLGIYTGVLLSANAARPLWNSSLLGFLFLISGLSTAAALVHLIAKRNDEQNFLTRADNYFLTIELGVIVLFLIGLLTGTNAHKEAAGLLLTGTYAPSFWVFVIGMGILAPLLLQVLAVKEKITHSPVPAIFVLIGGLILRFVILFAGQASHWTKGTM